MSRYLRNTQQTKSRFYTLVVCVCVRACVRACVFVCVCFVCLVSFFGGGGGGTEVGRVIIHCPSFEIRVDVFSS